MSENFQLEIISPEKTFLKAEVQQVTIPSFEGLMTILKDHISIVTFLRPGLIELKKSESLGYIYIFIAGLFNDVVTGTPIGLSSLMYLILCVAASYLRNITLRPSLVKDQLVLIDPEFCEKCYGAVAQ